jgi:polyisoprenoid-binding protein YceI
MGWAMSVLTPTLLQPGTWQADPARSAVGFRVRHFGVATVRGRFGEFAAEVVASGDALRVDGRVDVASVTTGHEIRDRRLRDEFFDAARYPSIALTGQIHGHRLAGALTIRDATCPIAFDVTVAAAGDAAVRVRAHGKIRRSGFGLEWEALRDAGRLLVADEVGFALDLVLAR